MTTGNNAPPPKSQRSPGHRDIRIGERIRALRLSRNVTQIEFGRLLDISRQQVQKYETGTNRLSAARLQQVASVLNAPVSALLEEESLPDGEDTDDLFHQASRKILRLLRAFAALDDPAQRKKAVELVEAMAEGARNGRHTRNRRLRRRSSSSPQIPPRL